MSELLQVIHQSPNMPKKQCHSSSPKSIEKPFNFPYMDKEFGHETNLYLRISAFVPSLSANMDEKGDNHIFGYKCELPTALKSNYFASFDMYKNASVKFEMVKRLKQTRSLITRIPLGLSLSHY